jgi:hypothetical protein
VIKKNSMFRKLQRTLHDGMKKVSKEAGEIGDKVSDSIAEIDERYDLGEQAKSIAEKTSNISRQTGVSSLANKTIEGVGSAWKYSGEKLKQIDDEIHLQEGLSKATHAVKQTVLDPVDNFLGESGVKEKLSAVGSQAENVYGETRRNFKPYFEPNDAEELLRNTRSELVYITSCILQVSREKADNWLGAFGKVLTAKVAGILGTGTLLGLVSTFGTAGTGTAIGSLSGAAATNATLAWVGGLLGGGMATGAILTAGVGLVVGVSAYKLLGSQARSYEELETVDKGIVETTGTLVAIIDEILAKEPVNLTPIEAELFLQQTLIPFSEELIKNADDVCSRLDGKNALAYRQHVLKDFKPVVIDGFQHLIGRPGLRAEAIIGGVIYALLSRTALDGSPEQEMVLDALRRSTNGLENASEADLSEYLSSQSPEQLQGIANNVKGIYHEMRWVADYNAKNDDTFARVMEATNHPGYDVEIVDNQTGEVLKSFQHKATDNLSNIREHQERYQDIDVLATSESASRMDGIESSGFSNEELTDSVNFVFDTVGDNTIGDQVFESAGIVGLAAAGREAISVLQGKTEASDAAKATLVDIAQAATATGITAYLFS